MGKIIWMSSNTVNTMKLDNNTCSFLKINDFMPKIFIDSHDRMLNNFYNKGHSDHIYKLSDVMITDGRGILSSAESFVKLFFEQDRLSLMTYIKKLDEKSIVLLSNRGEIDSYGQIFHSITGLSPEFVSNHPNIPIFWFIPTLIPFFLPTLYNLPDFSLEVSLQGF